MYTADAALLHDIGHDVATLSALVAVVRAEVEVVWGERDTNTALAAGRGARA